MTSPFPGYIAWPLHVVTLLVILIRSRYFNATLAERCATLSLSIMLLTQLLREHLVQGFLDMNGIVPLAVTRQVGTCGIVASCAEYLAFVIALAGAPDDVVKRRLAHYWITAGVCSVVMLWLGTDARERNSVIEITGGWDGVFYWAVFSVLPGALAYHLFRLSFVLLRQHRLAMRERFVAVVTGGEAAFIAVACLIAIVLALGEVLGLTRTVEFRLETHSRNFFIISAVGTLLSAIVIIHALWSSVGLDETSRRWRKLLPLWSALVSAFPEVTLEMPEAHRYHRVSLFRIHRTVVEIRDGILRMRMRHAPLPEKVGMRFVQEHKVPPVESRAAVEALWLAVALHEKADRRPSGAFGAAVETRSVAQSLDDELEELLRVSKWWPAAQEAALTLELTPEESSMKTSNRK